MKKNKNWELFLVGYANACYVSNLHKLYHKHDICLHMKYNYITDIHEVNFDRNIFKSLQNYYNWWSKLCIRIVEEYHYYNQTSCKLTWMNDITIP